MAMFLHEPSARCPGTPAARRPFLPEKARFHHEEMGRIAVLPFVVAVGVGDHWQEPTTRPSRSGRFWSSAGAATTTRIRRTSSPGASPGALTSSGPSPTTPTRPPGTRTPFTTTRTGRKDSTSSSTTSVPPTSMTRPSIDTILKPHKDGLPGVVLHCAMHCYRTDGWNRRIATPWMQFTGLISTGHGPQQPIAVTYVDRDSPITKPLGDWTTVNEELYNNAAGKLEPTAHALARGKQGRVESIVTWTNTYNGKTKVFGTTLGHNSATVADPRYLDLVTRGLLWAVDKLDDRYLRDPDLVVPEDLSKGKPATASSTAEPRPCARGRR